jgi:DNA processing protein
LGDVTVRRLIQAFGSPDAVFQASTGDLMARGGLTRDLADTLHRPPDAETTRAIDSELHALERLRASVITCLDSRYPVRLLTIPDPPPLLYLTGELTDADRFAVAVVGSRHASPAGRAITERLSRELAAVGLTIISGLARGVDAAAHRGALDGPGRTIAVLGCGIDQTYPREHQKLRDAIEGGGAVMTECPVGAPPHPHHFPKRNRIISGLSLGVLVTEAATQSGSLITARLAAEQGREVFAVPGPITSENSRGPHGLIRQGAKLVEVLDDILEELLPQLDDALRARLKNRGPQPIESQRALGSDEATLHDLLSFEPMHIDDLIRRTGLSASDVSAAMVTLELQGLVKPLPGQQYIRGR